MHFNTEAPALLLGLGNLLMEDEGVGLHVLKAIEEKYSFAPAIEIVDGGTAGFELLPFFEHFDKVLMIDAVEFREEPGFVGVLENDNILTELTNKMSLHHLGITDVLSVSKLMDYMPSDVRLIGIEPERIDVGMDLSDTVKNRINDVIQVTLKILENWGIQAVAKE